MYAHELEVGQEFYATLLGLAKSPVLTVAKKMVVNGKVLIWLPHGEVVEYKLNQKVRLLASQPD